MYQGSTHTAQKNRKRAFLHGAWGFKQQSSDKQPGPTGAFNTPVNTRRMCGWNITQLEQFESHSSRINEYRNTWKATGKVWESCEHNDRAKVPEKWI